MFVVKQNVIKDNWFESHTKYLHNTKITLTINKYIKLIKGTYYNKSEKYIKNNKVKVTLNSIKS